ncbi:MAG: hypothetical protein LBU65_03500, partial [Planctomycetaceae bacterium]|nr:hypothetical protein [Planctomycetaceae bacterium]
MMAYRLLVVMLSIVSVFLYAERSVNSEPSDENQTEQVARLNIKASFITTMISDGGGAPKDWKECPNEVKDYLLPEDYITCVAEDATGTIWLSTRRRGFMAIDPKTGRRGTGDRESMGMADNYVSSILPMPDGKPLIGLYIGGV